MRASDASDDGCDSGNAGRAETASDDPSPIPHALRVLDDSAGDMLAKLSDASIGAEELVHALIERRRMLGDELNAIVTTCDDEALATAWDPAGSTEKTGNGTQTYNVFGLVKAQPSDVDYSPGLYQDTVQIRIDY
jgi:hypothetical protein